MLQTMHQQVCCCVLCLVSTCSVLLLCCAAGVLLMLCGVVLCCSGERIMKLAEELYQAGFISYPRTETDVYDPGMDLRVSVRDGQLQKQSSSCLTAVSTRCCASAAAARKGIKPCNTRSHG